MQVAGHVLAHGAETDESGFHGGPYSARSRESAAVVVHRLLGAGAGVAEFLVREVFALAARHFAEQPTRVEVALVTILRGLALLHLRLGRVLLGGLYGVVG